MSSTRSIFVEPQEMQVPCSSFSTTLRKSSYSFPHSLHVNLNIGIIFTFLSYLVFMIINPPESYTPFFLGHQGLAFQIQEFLLHPCSP